MNTLTSSGGEWTLYKIKVLTTISINHFPSLFPKYLIMMLRWWKRDRTMLRWWNYDGEMVRKQWWKHDCAMMKTWFCKRWWKWDVAMVKRCHDDTMRFPIFTFVTMNYRFIVCHHRDIAFHHRTIAPSSFHHQTITFSPL